DDRDQVADLAKRALGACLVSRIDDREGLTRLDRVATLGVAADPDRMVDLVLGRATTRAELERGPPEAECRDLADEAVALRSQLAVDRGLRQPGREVAALRCDPALEHLGSRAVVDGPLGSLRS